MAFNPNETPIQKAIRLFKEGKEVEAIGMISKMRITRVLTKEQLKVMQIAFEMNNGLGSSLYQQMGFNKVDALARAKQIFTTTFIKD